MRSIRLLPVVIFAALALLVFKGIGLVTSGGYVLTGTTAAIAQESGIDASALMPSDTMASDTSPVVGDTSPSLTGISAASASASASGSMASSPAPSVAPPPGVSSAASALPPAPSAAASAPAPSSSAPDASSTASAPASGASSDASVSSKAEVCPESPRTQAAAPAGGDINDRIGNALVNGCPPPVAPTNEHGDVLPTTKDGNGKIVPLEQVTGDNSEQAILDRLGERRAELDKREADINMREALVAAAEKKLDEKTKTLQDLQAQVNALVDQKQAAEDAGFKAVVSMYETMKPKDAAAIFDTLDINVLLKIARAMNPRKMAPVLAAMSPQPAEVLTTALASVTPVATVADTSASAPGALPQIVGH